MYVHIRPKSENESEVCAVFESEEQAQRALDPDGDPEHQVHEWPVPTQPRLHESVSVREGKIVTHHRPGLVVLYENLVKRDEIACLRREKSALQQYAAGLEAQVQNKPSIYDRGRGITPIGRQVRDLWLCADTTQAQEQIVDHYVHSEQPTLNGRIMLVPDKTTAKRFNRRAQLNRIENGNFDASQGMAHRRLLLHSGDRIQFLRTDPELGVRDGDLADVVQLFPDLDSVVVALDRRKLALSDLVIVALDDYADIDLAYATTYDRAEKMDLYQVFVLAQPLSPTRELVDSLPSFHVEIYADRATAYKQFSDYLQEHETGQSIDREADPLANYHDLK